MSFVTTGDGTQIFYKDWGPRMGRPVVFSHGWPLSSDAFEDQMMALADEGFRCIAHDRRGHGRSSQTWSGHDMDTYAADLAAVVGALGVTNAVHVGHSTGGGEALRYVAQHAHSRAAKLVLISAVPPIMVQSPANPGGLPMTVFDDIRAGVSGDRSQFFKDLSGPFYGANREGSTVSQGLRDSFWLQGMMGGLKAEYDCVKAFSETDQTDDLESVTIPTLILHGDDDQIVPIAGAGELQAKLIKGATFKVYPGAPHGMCSTHKHQVNADLIAFLAA
ncbi:Non-heme chloroperoxidase [Methylobacterium tardum]|jgi:non-heme chloroperoxidase|uniref:Alpha/beta hydrolase n=1 Tax=Methylobacterium tardum TaxID=374432 RepID=A0AA37TFP8_9HYPH|nr:alpha/beta hydrolase [Methylobacterium tardum]GJE52939.1 Non-heme chloroperoxidase [Methylobacterium tardum]GLS70058.1 alpha/beta hydrolase [Methylobacterium tardum]